MKTMPRRSKKNRDLEPNLYENGEYYRYKHPVTKRFIQLGKDRKQANIAARIANAKLEKNQNFVAKILGIDGNIPALLDRFETEFLPEREYSTFTLSNITIKLAQYRREFAHTSIEDITVIELSDWLDQCTRSAYIKHRGLWINIYRYAMAKGLVTTNVAEATLAKKEAKSLRDRLSLADYKAIYALAEPWFQIAMDAALYTLQRRSDLIKIKHDDFQNSTLPIVQQKTGMAIEIKANTGLKDVFVRSRKTDVLSPLLIHRLPARRRREDMKKKEHWTAVTPGMLTKTFTKLREQAGVKPAPGKTPPSFHEIRSLGGRLLIEQGHSEEFVQVLMGHATMAMTEHYLQDGKRILWTQAEAGLVL